MLQKISCALPRLSVSSFLCKVKAYWRLLKPGVMSLVVFTGIVGLLLAPGEISLPKALMAIFCLAVGSGASGALNMWYERDIDALMSRTKARPLPQGSIQPNEALGFGVTLALFSVALMYIYVTPWATVYLSVAILFYVIVYTVWLKRRTPQNIVIGGAAGALPPVIGWAAVMNETSLFPWILWGIIFLWTPPHFWALALLRSQEYAKAGLPMLPVVAGDATTKNQILLYSAALVLLTFFPVYTGDLGLVYGAGAAILGIIFLIFCVKVKLSKDNADSLSLFFYSILYLFLLFLFMLVDRFVVGFL